MSVVVAVRGARAVCGANGLPDSGRPAKRIVGEIFGDAIGRRRRSEISGDRGGVSSVIESAWITRVAMLQSAGLAVCAGDCDTVVSNVLAILNSASSVLDYLGGQKLEHIPARVVGRSLIRERCCPQQTAASP